MIISLRYVMVLLFVFVNYYNPVSVHLTLCINIMLALYAFSISGINIQINERFVLVTTFVLLIWAMFIMVVRANIDMHVLGKYLRITVSSLLIMVICSQVRITVKQLIDVLSVIFIIHVMAIGFQSIFPQLDLPMANLFGFERETTIISDYTIRKMGCSSSYDTASLISISSMLFFFLQYAVRQKNIYLLFTFFSLLACTRTSRVGMVLGILFFIVLFVGHLFFSKGKKKLVPILVLLCGIATLIYFILPIIAYSTASYFVEEQLNNDIVATSDYTSGTVGALTSTHLDALKVPIFDLIIGFGIDPKSVGRNTDIGYVKLIYHVGIIGLVLILLLYLYIFRKAVIIKKKSGAQSDEFTLSSFLVLYVLLIIMMNYKSLEMYSRGCHDLLLIIFFVLTNKYAADDIQGRKELALSFVQAS